MSFHISQYLISVQVITSIAELKKLISTIRTQEKSIGFVPTMGALHLGHASLVRRAKAENELVIVSIFVNPTQFNNSADLTNYPRTIDSDIAILESIHTDFLFLPSVAEIYPENLSQKNVDLGKLDEIMEGKFRPGHFKGVVQVVSRFFDLIPAQKAYFGLKDFQQVAVIKQLKKQLNIQTEIVACETWRETSGLAMSSRNLRLSPSEKIDALAIYACLKKAKENATILPPFLVKKHAEQELKSSKLELEYFSIVDPETLVELSEVWVPGAIACIVAYAGEIRLIDNLELTEA